MDADEQESSSSRATRGDSDDEGRTTSDAGDEGRTTSDPDDETRVEVYPDREAIVEFDSSLTFECVDECTWCCRHGVLLYDKDFLELAERADLSAATTQFRGEDFVCREAKDREAHVADDGAACYFLQEDGLCELHAEHDWKPARCSVFPLEVYLEDGEIRVTTREKAWEHCEGMNVSERRVVDNLDAFLPEYLWELENPDTKRELG